MECPKCLQSVSDGSKFCNNCGNALQNIKSPSDKAFNKFLKIFTAILSVPIVVLLIVVIYLYFNPPTLLEPVAAFVASNNSHFGEVYRVKNLSNYNDWVKRQRLSTEKGLFIFYIDTEKNNILMVQEETLDGNKDVYLRK